MQLPFLSRFRRSFEEHQILVPRNNGVRDDLLMFRLNKNGVPHLTSQHMQNTKTGKPPHGDVAIASLLAHSRPQGADGDRGVQAGRENGAAKFPAVKNPVDARNCVYRLARMSKPTIFLSHIHEERELASIIKNTLICPNLLFGVDVFVSSDPESNEGGDSWFSNICENLLTSVSLFILASPASIERPWINTEAGAGWIRFLQAKGESSKRFRVVPLCHSGLRPSDLPLPWRTFNAFELNTAEGLSGILRIAAKICNLGFPTLNNLNDVLPAVASFEAKYKSEAALLSRKDLEEGNRRLQIEVEELRASAESAEKSPAMMCSLEGKAHMPPAMTLLLEIVNIGACGLLLEEIVCIWRCDGGMAMRTRKSFEKTRQLFVPAGGKTGLLHVEIPGDAIMNSIGAADFAFVKKSAIAVTAIVTATSSPYGVKRTQGFVLAGEELTDGRDY